VDLENGVVRNLTKGKEYRIRPYPEFLMKIMEAGGWLEYCLKEVGE
jgi:3-isopropylmalate/(R)-2-methylmalate dehydratase small subunit